MICNYQKKVGVICNYQKNYVTNSRLQTNDYYYRVDKKYATFRSKDSINWSVVVPVIIAVEEIFAIIEIRGGVVSPQVQFFIAIVHLFLLREETILIMISFIN